jgi:hypothetical protein
MFKVRIDYGRGKNKELVAKSLDKVQKILSWAFKANALEVLVVIIPD